MSANTGVGLPSAMSLQANLSDTDVPVFRAASNSLEPSGFNINAITRALQGGADIETTESVEAGVATFRLAQAHQITSAAENVTFRNTVTNTTFHPTWQTTEQEGSWASVQRTPTGDLVENADFQADGTEEVTNPVVMITSIENNHRLYEVTVFPKNTVTNVRATLLQNNGTEFVDYWRSRPIDVTADTPINVAINPFIDLFGNTEYQLTFLSPDGDVVVEGDSMGNPRMQITYREWRDDELATQRYVGDFRIDGLVTITANTTITADNVDTYQNKIWIIQGGQNPTVTVNDDVALTYFGFYANHNRGRFTIQRAADGTTTFNRQQRERFLRGRGSFFVRIAANTFVELEDTPLTGNFLELDDTPSSFGDAGTVPTVNAAENAMVFEHPNHWTHKTLTAGQMDAENRAWYTYTETDNITVQLPVESGISEGWHTFIGNDSVTAIITVEGNFRGDVEEITIRSQHGCIIGYNGTIYLEGVGRTQISVSNLPGWPDNPLIRSGSYTTDGGANWNSGSSGLNINNADPQTDMLNRLVTVQVNDIVYLVDMPGLTTANRTTIPVGSSYGFLNQGTMGVLIRPRGTQTIILGSTTFSFSNGLTLATGALAIITRTNDTTWTVSFHSGTLTGGTTS